MNAQMWRQALPLPAKQRAAVVSEFNAEHLFTTII